MLRASRRPIHCASLLRWQAFQTAGRLTGSNGTVSAWRSGVPPAAVLPDGKRGTPGRHAVAPMTPTRHARAGTTTPLARRPRSVPARYSAWQRKQEDSATSRRPLEVTTTKRIRTAHIDRTARMRHRNRRRPMRKTLPASNRTMIHHHAVGHSRSISSPTRRGQQQN